MLRWKMMAEKDELSEGSSAPVGEEALPSSDSSIWDDLLDDEPEVVAETEVEPAIASAEEVGREPEPAPVVEEKPKVEETPKAAVVEQRVEEAQTPPVQVVSQPAQPPPGPTPDQIFAYRQQVLAAVEKQYSLSEEDATALQVEPEKVLPKLAARLHANIYDQVMNSLAQQAPVLVAQQLKDRQETQAAEEAFFSRWQDLRPHTEQVQRVAQMWRQMYPKATLQEAIEGIGQSARALLGLGGPVAVQQEAVPTAPTVPARPAARGAPMRQAKSMSAEEQAFADLAKSFEEEF